MLWLRLWGVLLAAFCIAESNQEQINSNLLGVIQRMLPTVGAQTQTEAALDVIGRIAPNHKKKFEVIIDESIRPADGRDVFILQKSATCNVVYITATSGVTATWGFNHYLKYFCNSHVSWETSNIDIPSTLPDVNVTITANDWVRYYQNVCTTSYSFVWWNWAQWEKHTDWMALNGINLALAFNGQEAIWERVYKRLTMTQEEINEHFSGPAYFSWLRMGNMRGFGGPLSENWHFRSLALQKMIVKKLRNLGIKTVLPAFAGHVPRAFARIQPNAPIKKLEPWCDFPDKYCCPYVLDPTSPLFKRVGRMFMEEQLMEFGTDHFYNCDTYNEMTPISSNLTYLSNLAKSTYASMAEVDKSAIWVLQGWAFYNDESFWGRNETESFLTGVPLGKMLILDLQSEQFPQFQRLESYFGQPFVWCMLHNFGGTLGLFGSLDILNENVFEARKYPNGTMVGTGLTPEGINQNYVVYEFMLEMGWRKNSTDVLEWIGQYIRRRYGKDDPNAQRAWGILAKTVYNYKGLERMRGKYVVNRRPALNIRTWIWYDFRAMIDALKSLVKADLGRNEGFLHDLVDVSRQLCQVVIDQLYLSIVKAFKAQNKHNFQGAALRFLLLFDEMEKILRTNEAFLLGNWLNSAKAIGMNDNEVKQYEYNARNQITLWGPDGEILDYASKQWSGVVSNYFKPRWSMFIAAMNDSLINNSTFDQQAIQKEIFEKVEAPFTFDRTSFPVDPSGDIIKIVNELLGDARSEKIILPHEMKVKRKRERVAKAVGFKKRIQGRKLTSADTE